MNKLIRLSMLVLFMLSAVSIQAAFAESPLQVALIDPVQLVSSESNVKGFRLNFIRGVNEDVTGLDFGLINKSNGIHKGVQLGIYNSTFDFAGLQFGLINRTDFLSGVQIGLINFHDEGELGFFPLVNLAF